MTATPQTTTTYTVVARDGNGCSAQETVTVEVYTLPTVTIADVADICPNAGSQAFTATANLDGATNPTFNYSWSCENTALTITGNGSTATLSNIPSTCTATTYTVNVLVTELSHNCQATASNTVTVKDDENPTIEADVTSILAEVSTTGENCIYQMPDLINNANIHYTITDNCSSQNYLLAHMSQSVNAGTDISANQTVEVTVTDSCGKAASVFITVTVPQAQITLVTGTHTNVLCPGGTNGIIQILPQNTTGGLPPYKYRVDDGAYVENLTGALYDFENITAGTHILTVMDASGCTASQEVVITAPPAFDVTISTSNATCANNDGQVSVAVTGGTPSTVTG